MTHKLHLQVLSPCIALIALGCAQIDRSLGDTAGSGGSAGSSTTGGSSSATGGSSSATGGSSSATGGSSSIGGGPTVCGAVPEAPRDDPAPTTREVAWNRISWFLADEAPNVGEPLPGQASAEWAGQAALSLLDSFGAEPAPGLASFLATWMPEVGEPELWALAFSGQLTPSDPDGRMMGLFTYPAAPMNPGILADPSLLQAKPGISSRGAWLLEHLFCMTVPDPPPDLPEPTMPPPAGMTRRQALEAEVSAAPCMGCHAILDPLAYSLENYDELGVFRTVDSNGLPIDSSGTYTSPMGEMLVFGGLTEVAAQLGTSCEVAQCIARSLLTDAMRANGLLGPSDMPAEAEVNRITQGVVASGFSLREMIRGVAESLAFYSP